MTVNSPPISPGHDEAEEFAAITSDLIHDKIVHVLTIWPQLSPSMLQVGIGTAVSPRIWHPVLENMISTGKIVKNEVRARSPTGRDQVYTVLELGKVAA